MADIIGSRLEWLIRERRTTQTAVALAIGISQPSIGRLISGETRETGKLIELARVLKTSPEYLIGEIDDPDLLPTFAVVQESSGTDIAVTANDDEVEIDSIDLGYGMGGTFLDPAAINIEKARFSRAWLRKFTHSPPDLLFTTEGVGDSMMPTINDHDVVIVDRSQRIPEQGDRIWAMTFGGVDMIKRLRPMPDGTVKISSDNQFVRDEVATDGDLYIVGRVVAVVRRV
jgi:phage repressor protein C with HTH and peptisase S24 domain